MAYAKSPTAVSPAARITREIIARLEAGTRPWIKPWRGVPVPRPLRACGAPYRGMNVFWLWMVADKAGYASPFWMTYAQARKLGGQVRKGETSTIAIFYKSYVKEVEAPDTGERSEEPRRVLKAYPVFNADQVDGLPEKFHPAPALELVEPEGRRAELDAFFARMPAVLRHQGDEAYYEPGIDRITMPVPELFSGFDHYYATLAHEVGYIATVLVRVAIFWLLRSADWDLATRQGGPALGGASGSRIRSATALRAVLLFVSACGAEQFRPPLIKLRRRGLALAGLESRS